MTKARLIPAVEAVLFACGEPVPLSKLAQAVEATEDLTAWAVKALQERMAQEGSGLEILPIEDGYQMASKAAHATPIRNLLEIRRNTPLSQAAFEVLSVVAYHQPVTKAYIEQVRGVDCSGVVSSLVNKGLIAECGRLDLPGRPLIYGTTDTFLRCFSLDSLGNLPPIPVTQEADSMAPPEEAE